MMRQRIARLLFRFSFAILVVFLSTVLTQVVAQAQSANPPGVECGVCHKAIQLAWENDVHSPGVAAPAFDASWEELGKQGWCLVCHATGYDPATGTVRAEGITCQACHNLAKTNHPMEPMPVDEMSEICGNCHTVTYQEWHASRHRQAGVDCLSCHETHASVTRADGSYTVACTNCHEEYLENEAHLSHASQRLDCLTCHIPISPYQGMPDELGDTAHSFTVDAGDCIRCHVKASHLESTIELFKVHTRELDCVICHAPPEASRAELKLSEIMPATEPFACEDCHTPVNGRVNFAALGYTEAQIRQLTWSEFPPITETQASILSPDSKEGWSWLWWLQLVVGAFVIFELTVARKLKSD